MKVKVTQYGNTVIINDNIISVEFGGREQTTKVKREVVQFPTQPKMILKVALQQYQEKLKLKEKDSNQ